MRHASKERVDRYCKQHPSDERSDKDVLKCIKEIESDSRYQDIMINNMCSQGSLSDKELKEGRCIEW